MAWWMVAVWWQVVAPMRFLAHQPSGKEFQCGAAPPVVGYLVVAPAVGHWPGWFGPVGSVMGQFEAVVHAETTNTL